MSNRYTVITLNEPDPAALAWAVADINPDFYLVVSQEKQQWEVYDTDDTTLLFTVDAAYYVQVPGEIARLFGSTAGLNFEPLGGEQPTYWMDVNAVRGSERAEAAAAKFAQLCAHLGLGTAVQHGPVFTHLGEADELLRPEWKD
ncbi:hypothetical protein [Falsarthrobacter nasiphocae]|uniref:Uncharacterized protein n=1 Tax=Falsarthrobacter nasiphocae TaxID=189863 RepID=A0AAE4C5D6_9MICC|nr:hypothetical protein [Falsarthrobacter nasiphocae]MDR6892236.1 hypothetical protein [Falsarthrobacter nasiphocae]